MSQGGIRRAPVRYEVSLAARFRAVGEQDWSEGQLANLSAGGLCLVAAEADLLAGQEVEIVIETVDKFLRAVPRLIRARVVWSRGGRHGVQFARPAAGDPFAGTQRSG